MSLLFNRLSLLFAIKSVCLLNFKIEVQSQRMLTRVSLAKTSNCCNKGLIIRPKLKRNQTNQLIALPQIVIFKLKRLNFVSK